MGFGKMAIPCQPPVETAGRREHWLQFDPRALREWVMAPMAIALGLQPLDPDEAARVPKRALVDDVLVDGSLPALHVYVGPGNHRHRLRRTKWASPLTPGHDCSLDEWLPRYVEHVYDNLIDDLGELE